MKYIPVTLGMKYDQYVQSPSSCRLSRPGNTTLDYVQYNYGIDIAEDGTLQTTNESNDIESTREKNST